MAKKRIAKHPLLYIDQPTVNAPKASMQSTYQSSLNKNVEPVTQKKKPRTIQSRPKRIQRKKQFMEGNEEESTSGINNQMEQDDALIEDEVSQPKFKDMSIQEKIRYFANVPTHIPKMKCEIKTGERSFRGVITDFDDKNVFMRIGKRVKSTAILTEDIKDIRMLGF